MSQVVNIRWATWLMTSISAVTWVAVALMTGADLSKPWEFLRLVPQVVTVDAVVIAVFAKWGWSVGVLQGWLVRVPDLNGTWIGEIRSDYLDVQQRQLAPVPAMLTVRQSLLSLSCVVQTAEMRSDSYAEGFRIDDERQLRQVAYSYSSRPSPLLRERSTSHHGTVLMNVIAQPKRRLRGQYWTDRRTSGEVEFAFRERRRLEELPPDLPPHPMALEEGPNLDAYHS